MIVWVPQPLWYRIFPGFNLKPFDCYNCFVYSRFRFQFLLFCLCPQLFRKKTLACNFKLSDFICAQIDVVVTENFICEKLDQRLIYCFSRSYFKNLDLRARNISLPAQNLPAGSHFPSLNRLCGNSRLSTLMVSVLPVSSSTNANLWSAATTSPPPFLGTTAPTDLSVDNT